jgi:hypothetical protein
MPITRDNIDLNYKLTLIADRYIRIAPNKLMTFTGVEQLTPTQWNATNLHRINKPFVTSPDQVRGKKKDPIMSSCFLINPKQTLTPGLQFGNVKCGSRASSKFLGNTIKGIRHTTSIARNNTHYTVRHAERRYIIMYKYLV